MSSVRLVAWVKALMLSLTLASAQGADVSATASSTVPQPPTSIKGVTIKKSSNDDRQYRYLTLDNALQVLLISDPDTDQAAAAVDINIGSYSDPDTRPGLAHFLEHMLFLGTEKYPQSDDYHGFISRHGGRHNAYTAAENTNYFFNIDKGYLKPALDRFAQFFIAPLFTADYVNREINAVDSEYRSKLKSDGWRFYSVRKALANPEHPYARFTIGNLETLADRPDAAIRDEVIEFYRRHYSANRMTLVVLGQEPLETLQSWVEESFSAVANRQLPLETIDVPLYSDAALPKKVVIQPVRDQRQLSVSFPIPPVQTHYRSKPTSYIANLLGHEGQGSLLSLLKAQGWADGLSAGLGTNDRDNASFSVNVQLTPAGLQNSDAIVELIFAYLDLIESQGIQRWRFEEQQQLANIAFEFQEQIAPVRYVSALASSLQVLPPEDVIYGSYAMERFEPELIRRYLALMRPERALIIVIDPDEAGERQTPWFDAPYRVVQAAVEAERDVAELAQALALPKRNPFIPTDLSVNNIAQASVQEGAPPERLLQSEGLTLWFKHDDTFNVPRANIYFSVRSPVANASPKQRALSELFVRLIRDELTEYAYPAQLAGLGYDLYAHARGFSVQLEGYDDKQIVLLTRLIEALREPTFDPKRFDIILENYRRGLKNAAQEPPQRQAANEVVDLLIDPQWRESALLEALDEIDLAALREHHRALLGQLDLVALVHGNLLVDTANAVGQLLQEQFLAKAQITTVERPKLARLTPGRHHRPIEVDNPDHAIAFYVQGKSRDYPLRARYGLMAQILRTPFFQTLRTEKQLGYIVYASPMVLLEVPGLVFGVQSPVATPQELEGHIDQFLQEFVTLMAAMTPEEFEAHRSGLLSQLRQQDDNLRDRSNRYWREIDRENFEFDTPERLAEAVEALDQEELVAFYRDTLLAPTQPNLVVFASQAPAQPSSTQESSKATATAADNPAETAWIADPKHFKMQLERFPG